MNPFNFLPLLAPTDPPAQVIVTFLVFLGLLISFALDLWALMRRYRFPAAFTRPVAVRVARAATRFQVGEAVRPLRTNGATGPALSFLVLSCHTDDQNRAWISITNTWSGHLAISYDATAFVLVGTRTRASRAAVRVIVALWHIRGVWYDYLPSALNWLVSPWRQAHPPFQTGDTVMWAPEYADEDERDDRYVVREVVWSEKGHEWRVEVALHGSDEISAAGVASSFASAPPPPFLPGDFVMWKLDRGFDSQRDVCFIVRKVAWSGCDVDWRVALSLPNSEDICAGGCASSFAAAPPPPHETA